MKNVLLVQCKKCQGRLLSIQLPVPVREFVKLAKLYPKAYVRQYTDQDALNVQFCRCEDEDD